MLLGAGGAADATIAAMSDTWDVGGRTVLVTGGTTGIGRATVEELARRGAEVIFTARSVEAGDRVAHDVIAATGNHEVTHRPLHLDDLAQVREFAAGVRADLDELHVLVNNAGLSCPERRETVDGYELMFGVNHLGHFLLVEELRPLIEASAPARIVIVASDAHRFGGPLDFDDLQSEQAKFGVVGGLRAYGRSKLANILHARALARRLEGTGVTVNCLHPGMVRTRHGRDSEGSRIGEVLTSVIAPFALTPEKGARTSVWAATAPELDGVSGEYLAKSRIAKANAQGRDDAAAERLWAASEQLVGP